MKRASRIIAGLVPLTLIASIWAVQDSTPPEDPKVELSKVLAPEIRSMDSGAVLQRGNQVGFVSCSTWDRTVNIFWSASPLMNEKPDWDNALQQWEDLIDVLDNDYQEYPVAFYPNLAEVIDANTLLVAGATADQESIIEKWTLKWPAVEEEPALDPQTGKLSVEVILPVEITTQLIFLGGTRNDPQFIRAMCGVATQEDGVVASLVLFHESNELYTLDLGSNELSLLADPMLDQGWLGMIPELGRHYYDGVLRSEKVSGEFIYKFLRNPRRNDINENGQPSLVLLDANQDGVLDGHLVLTADEWVTQGWADVNNYVHDWEKN